MLILTSTGFFNKKIADVFLKELNKAPQLAKVAFVPTASRTPHELKYIESSKEELFELGIKPENLVIFNLDKKVIATDLDGFDVLYVCGGNTFYLMKKINETGFDKTIKAFVKKGGLYVGVSAGSVVAGPVIKIALPFDENDSNLTNFDGLGLVDVIISPHYIENDKAIIENYAKSSACKVIALTDSQALLVNGELKEIFE